MNHALRALWNCVHLLCFRPSPRVLHSWRRMLLRLFGARLGKGVVVHPSVKIWAPWNLIMDDHSCLGPYVDCYNCATVALGRHSVVSQYSFLCTATHNYKSLTLPLIAKPIVVREHAWVCADVFVGPGVSVGEGAVVGARSSVFKDVDPWTVVAGSPARFLKARVLGEAP
jgi:putative colanic acid biosynthesis acetyltransferase WcaF